MAFVPLKNRLPNLPLILAGPILRRTVPEGVSVWIALKAARTVTLRVYSRQGSSLVLRALGTTSTRPFGADLIAAFCGVFPAVRTGTLRGANSMARAWKACLKAARITERFTRHGLRRTFNDMPRRAKVDPVIAKALSGHVTEPMREHYSTGGIDESERRWRRCCGSFPGKKCGQRCGRGRAHQRHRRGGGCHGSELNRFRRGRGGITPASA